MKSLECRRLLGLLGTPSVSPEVEARLASASPVALVEIASDPRETWWRRRPCALALRGRVPVEHAAVLLDRASDREGVAEVRRALLEALASSASAAAAVPLLEWLRAQDGREQAYGMHEAILAARAQLRDLTAVPALATLACDPWTHRRRLAEQALDRMISACGLDTVVQALGAASLHALAFAGPRPEDRLLGMRLTYERGLDVSEALADDDVVVARAAYERMADGSGASDEALLARVAEGQGAAALCRDEQRPSGAAAGCLWALCTLARRGHDVRPWWKVLGEPRVPLDLVPQDVRLAILRHYVPGERHTDPRLLLEVACLEPSPEPSDPEALEAELLARATAALTAAGISPGSPRSAGEIYQQGAGTYHAIDTAEGTVEVSTLGPFARLGAASPRAHGGLTGAGFRVIDEALAQVTMTGLHVYFFGDREPLCIGDLLFYWQD